MPWVVLATALALFVADPAWVGASDSAAPSGSSAWAGPRTQTSSGQGWLRVVRADGGDQVLAAIALDSPHKTPYHVTTHRLFRILTGLDLSGTRLGERVGRLALNYGTQDRVLTIFTGDGRPLLAVSLGHYRAGEAQPELLRLADGTPLVVGAIQIAWCDYDAESLAALAPERQESTGPAGLEDAGLRALHELVKRELDIPPPPLDCNACTAGGSGSSDCSIGGCPQIPHDCSTHCGSGYYACCRCSGGTSGSAQCGCCKGAAPESPGGGQ
jgi:hypothetical protein